MPSSSLFVESASKLAEFLTTWYRFVQAGDIGPVLVADQCGIVSDGFYKTRFLALPGEADIEFSRDEFCHFPANTVLEEKFYLQFTKGHPASRQIVETRFLVKVGTLEEWRGFSYKWNDDASDAVLLRDRETLAFLFKIQR